METNQKKPKANFKKIGDFLGDAINLRLEKSLVLKMSLEDARSDLQAAMNYVLGKQAVWLPEYEEVAKWLSDNDGKGLTCIGNCGRGKTLMCTNALPLLIHHYCNKTVHIIDATDMNARPDDLLKRRLLAIDDFGQEGIRYLFGDKRMIFSEILDKAEKNGSCLLLTTNLSYDEIVEKYGIRTVERIRATTKIVEFLGDSLR